MINLFHIYLNLNEVRHFLWMWMKYNYVEVYIFTIMTEA